MASRDLKHLHPKLQPLATAFLAEAKRHDIDVLVTCTYRSNAEQAMLYAKGRTAPGPKVTNAKPGQSKHNFTLVDGTPASLAFDVVPLVNGKPEWKASHPSWAKLGMIGKRLGLEWAGDWTRMREFPHFQLKG
jgi:peptidoglycan L-alanyl-D-glutamate endopeptidase CwlK